jgi:hypothetical protein
MAQQTDGGKRVDTINDQPVAEAASPVAGQESATGRAPASPGHVKIGLLLIGLLSAGAGGYFLGARSGAAPVADATAATQASSAAVPAPPPQIVAAPGPAAPAAVTEGKAAGAAKVARAATPRTTHRHAPAKMAKPAQTPAAKLAATSGESSGGRLQDGLATCGKYNIFCREKVRWHYCKGQWGKVPDCPQVATN